jgi:integrase
MRRPLPQPHLSRVFKVAKKWGFCSGDNPASGVTLPEKRPVREKHILQPEQISALLLVLKEPVPTMVLLGVLTGLRVGEILGLSWKSLDFTSGAYGRWSFGWEFHQRTSRIEEREHRHDSLSQQIWWSSSFSYLA